MFFLAFTGTTTGKSSAVQRSWGRGQMLQTLMTMIIAVMMAMVDVVMMVVVTMVRIVILMD
jgi:hypothetical protein